MFNARVLREEGQQHGLENIVKTYFDDRLRRDSILLSREERTLRAKLTMPNIFSLMMALITADNFQARYTATVSSLEKHKSLLEAVQQRFTTKQLKSLKLNDLYEKIFLDAQIEKKNVHNFLQEKLARLQDQLNHYQQEKDKKEGFAAIICELLLAKRSEGHVMTQVQLETGLNLSMSHAPISVIQYMSSEGLSCCPKTAHKVMDFIDKRYVDSEEKYLSDVKLNTTLIPIVCFDNYNHITWRKYNNSESTFTRNVPSISAIYKFYLEPTLSLPLPEATSFNIDIVLNIVRNGFQIPELMKDISDLNYRNQSIYNFHIHPSIVGRSSSTEDVKEKILTGILTDKMNIQSKPIFTLVDPEIQSLMFLQAYLEPTKYIGMQFLPPPFHCREHLIYNFFCDPTFSILFFLPCLYESFRLQQKKRKKQHQNTLKKVYQYVDSNSSQPWSLNQELLQQRRKQRRNLEAIEEELSKEMSGVEEDTEDEDDSDERFAPNAQGENEDDDDDEEIKIDGVLISDNVLRQALDILKQYILLGGRENDVTYSDLQSNKMNFARLLYVFQLIYAAYLEIKDSLQAICLEANSWCCTLLFDLLENGIAELCVKPFQMLVLEGKGQSIITLIPIFTNIMGHYNRVKVVRGTAGTLNTLEWWRSHPDFLKYYLMHCCSCNELYIELLHSLFSRQLPSNTEITSSMIQQQASHVMIRKDLFKRKRLSEENI